MSVRLSFGSRAEGAGDYQSSHHHHHHNNNNNHGGGSMRGQGHWSRGPFDSVDDLTESLKLEIEASQNSAVPDCTTVELHLSLHCPLPLHRPSIGPYAEGGDSDLPLDFKTATTRDDGSVVSDPFPRANAHAVINVAGARQRQIVQRAASRGIIAALQGADGYRYSFNNAWTAKDEEGSRFSYICQDSMQNKDRHANGYTRTLKHLKGDGERGPRKPTYDCKGSISVKFSTTKQSVDVYYRHYAIHATVAGRKPPPRPAPKPRASMGDATPSDMGGLAAALQAESMHFDPQAEQYASSALGMVERSPPTDPPFDSRPQAPHVATPLKRKRDWNPTPAARTPHDPNAPVSLMELLQQSEPANVPAAAANQPKNSRAGMPPPVHYELPSWQIPPPPPNRAGQGHAAPYMQPVHAAQKPASPQKHRLSSGSVPRGQGLFTTMKPIAKDWVVQTSYSAGKPELPSYPTYNTLNQSSRAKTSCTNCRLGKKKCDEQRPQCGACVKSGRSDCLFEGAPNPSDLATSQQSSQNANSWGSLSRTSAQPQTPGWKSTQSTQSTPGVMSDTPGSQLTPSMGWPNPEATPSDRGVVRGSPDPWFPKR